ncbi:MAG: tripartite tricarboxylate transporter permease, partial [Candidatus Thermoplasmatota archaeon]|nr:tripartite tricarboxylate transporter permease [Candidatus Thermoplasmatota archaeon]
LGAPEEDTALSVLPAHSLLLEGKGFEAVALSALGSYGAIVVCFLVLLPVRSIFGWPIYFYETLKEIMIFVLISISILMIATEKGKITDFGIEGKKPAIFGMLFALLIFALSGFFGLIILNFSVDSPIGLPSPVLFPALAGLFGTPTLLTSLMTKPKIPKQKTDGFSFDSKAKKATIISVLTGSFGGILVSIIPGITSATGTILAMNARGESDKRQTIVTLSAVNTACAFFVVVVLFVILRARSGAALAALDLIVIQEWVDLMMPINLIYLLIAMTFAGMLSYFSTIYLGKLWAKKFSKVPYQKVILATIFLVSILVFLFTGLMGLFILVVATLIGLLPVQWGVRRSHCMGVLLIPIIIHFL